MQSSILLQEPFLNCVYQRDNNGFASIPVAGKVTAGLANVKAIFSRKAVGTVQTLAYQLPIEQTLPVDKEGNFGGSVQVPGGWYSLAVIAGDTTATLNAVGAGEVFGIFGHSYMQGGADQNHQFAATDERVIALQDTLSQRNFQFAQLTGRIGPFHDYPDTWGQFGDRLVKRLGVPVMFFGAAYGGSNILQNYQLLKGETRTQLPPGTTDPASRQPFQPLETVMQYYVPKTGIRGLLVEHGYNDRGTPTDTFIQRFKYVFDYIRNTFNKPDLALVVVQEELQTGPYSLADPDTAKGLQQIIATYPNTYKGPDFNSTFWPAYHTQNKVDHLYGIGIDQFAADWDASLTDQFFKSSTPYLPSVTPNVLPLMLYNVPTGPQLGVLDWFLLGLTGLLLVGIVVKKRKGLLWAFIACALIALGRITGKI